MVRGIVYVAWGDKWLNEAARSAASVKKTTGLSTCLMTDNSFVDHWSRFFDSVKPVDFSRFDGMHYHMRKWICLVETPFESTLFLDTDTIIGDSLDLGFDLAEQFDLCMTISPGMLLHHEGREHIHYNGGVMFFRGLRPALLSDLCDVALRLEGSGLIGDEPVISIAFRELGINPVVLPTVFNAIRAGQIHNRRIKVFHSRWTAATQLVSDQFGNEFTHEMRGW